MTGEIRCISFSNDYFLLAVRKQQVFPGAPAWAPLKRADTGVRPNLEKEAEDLIPLDKLTYKAQEALQGSQELARQLHHNQLEPAHLLRTLLSQEEGLIGPLLKKLEADPQKLLQGTEDLLTRLPRVSGEAQVYLSPAYQ